MFPVGVSVMLGMLLINYGKKVLDACLKKTLIYKINALKVSVNKTNSYGTNLTNSLVTKSLGDIWDIKKFIV